MAGECVIALLPRALPSPRPVSWLYEVCGSWRVALLKYGGHAYVSLNGLTRDSVIVVSLSVSYPVW